MSTKTTTCTFTVNFIARSLFKIQTFVGLMILLQLSMSINVWAQNLPPKIEFYTKHAPKEPTTKLPLFQWSLGIPVQTPPVINSVGGKFPTQKLGLESIGFKGIMKDGVAKTVENWVFGVVDTSLATYAQISSITTDKNGKVYMIDSGYIRKIENNRSVTYKKRGNYRLIQVDSKGNCIVVDGLSGFGQTIKKIDSTGNVTLIAGSGLIEYSSTKKDGVGASATFGSIKDMVIDKNDNLYIIDERTYYYLIRKITPDGTVTSIIGGDYTPKSTVSLDGTGFA
jgi:hypothetical protein